jgi:hypothetical protein
VLRGQPHGRLLPHHRKLATAAGGRGNAARKGKGREVVRVVVYGRKRKSDGGGLVVASGALLYRARVKRNSYYYNFFFLPEKSSRVPLKDRIFSFHAYQNQNYSPLKKYQNY